MRSSSDASELSALLQGLPAAGRVLLGLRDLQAGEWSKEAFWVAIASRRLRAQGLPVPLKLSLPEEPEAALYAALQQEGGDAYYRYNAMRRELDSFLNALDRRSTRPTALTACT